MSSDEARAAVAAAGAGADATEAGRTDRGVRADHASDAGVRSISRRQLCYGVGGVAVLAALGGLKLAGTQPVVRPPGGQDEGALLSKCVHCLKCAEACPQHVISPARIEGGILGMRTPVLGFSSSYCDWCAGEGGSPRCVAACPTGALSLPAGAAAQTTVLGCANITTDWCLAYRLTGCRYCYDACPYHAISLDEQGCPHIVEELCCGCGACEAACVSLANGSISQGATHRAVIVEPMEG